MWKTLLQDNGARGFLAVTLLLNLPYLLSASPWIDVYANRWFDFFFLPAVLWALRFRLGELDRRERPFWDFLSWAILSWWIVRVIYVTVPDVANSVETHLVVDGAYTLFYVFLWLAAETKPHVRSERPGEGPVKRLGLLGFATLILGLLFYFVFIPLRYEAETYLAWWPSLYLYLVLDVVVAARFGQLALSCRHRRWRVVYGLLGGAALLWLCTGLLEIAWRDGPDGLARSRLGQCPVAAAGAVFRRRRPAASPRARRSGGAGGRGRS